MTIKIVNKLGAPEKHMTVDDMDYGDVFVLVGNPAGGPYMVTDMGDLIDLSSGRSISLNNEMPAREVNITIEVTP